MLKIYTMTLGAYQTNCYLVWREGSDTCVVIDPGYEPERILAQTRLLKKNIEAILLTHGHFDHVGGVKALEEQTGCKVYLCPQELSLPEQMTAGPLSYTHTYGEGDTLELAGLTFRVIRTPGHTPGSVCLLVDTVMFSGDTLFWGSCGRTDFPGGDWTQMLGSLRRLASLPGDYTVYPGHGGATNLEQERKMNPYMQ